MHITKLGHCCVLIETKGKKILTDPGSFTTSQNALTGIDIVLITHEHGDHFHVASVQEILKHNPQAHVVTNSAVGKKLTEVGVVHIVLEGQALTEIAGIAIEASDGKHEEIFEDIGQVQNTGYLIDTRLFYPGDSFHNPNKPVEILALPVSGPWCKIPDAIRYALALKPKKAFPVHDGMLQKDSLGNTHKMVERILGQHSITFTPMADGDSKEF